MEQNLSLTPAQIQYLKIGPKVGTSTTTTKQLQESLTKFDSQQNDAATSLSGMPKFSYGNFQKTVNNFGVLLHRNFVGTTTLHQAQKFGKVAHTIDEVMQQQKDKPVDQRHPGQKRSFIDSRTKLKAIYEYRGHRLLLTLSSFMLQETTTKKIAETLPLAYIKLMLNHVSSSRLSQSIQKAMRSQGSSMVIIDYQKMESKVSSYQNNQDKYSSGPFILQRNGHQFNIITPKLEIYHSESEYKKSFLPDNRDILEILESDFDNVQTIVDKYADFIEFQQHLDQMQPSSSQRHRQQEHVEPKEEKHVEPKEERPQSHHSQKRQPQVQQKQQLISQATPKPATPPAEQQTPKPQPEKAQQAIEQPK